MFYFDVPAQLQAFLNQFWAIINYLLIFWLFFLIYITYKKPVFAAGSIIVALPTYLFRAKIFGLPATYLELCLIIFFLTLTARFFILCRKKTKINAPKNKIAKLKFPLLLLLLAATISIFVSGNTVAAFGLWKAYFIEPILFFVALLKIVKTSKDKKIIFWSLGLSALLISFLAIFQKFTGLGIAEPVWVAKSTRRVTTFFTSPNAVGLFLGPIFTLYLAQFIYSIKNKTGNLRAINCWFLIIILILMSLAIIFTKSRGTWLGVLAGLIFLSYFGWNKKWTVIILILSILAILIIPTLQQATRPTIAFPDKSGQNRIATWNIAWQYLTKSPKNFLLGAGIFGFPEIHEQFRNPEQIEPLIYPHNIMLNFWLEIGLLGLIAMVWILFIFFKTGADKTQNINYQNQSIAIMATMIVILIHGLVDVPYFKNDLSILFWTIVGLIFI